MHRTKQRALLRPLAITTPFSIALAATAWAQTAGSNAADTTLPQVTVTAPRVSLRSVYLVPNTSTGLKIPAPIQDIPASVQVVPRALIEDRGVLSVDQATETVSNVERNVDFPTTIAFRIRGFDESYETLRDGFREQSNIGDVAGVERIDVLKGPASVLYGSALNSGGTVNVVTKQPVSGDFTRASVSGGSFGLSRETFDVNRDVYGDGTLAVGIDGAYQHDDTFKNFGKDERTWINPTIRWRPTDRDEVTLIASYLHQNFTWDAFQSPIVPQVLSLPISRNFSDPNLAASHEDAWRLGYNWTHRFDDGLSFRSGFNASVANFNFGSERLYRFSLEPDNQTLDRTVSIGPQRQMNFDLQNELSGSFMTGSIRHDWLTGIELYRETYEYKNSYAALPPLNIYAPVYGVSPGPFTLMLRGASRADGVAGYVQDFVTVVPQVKLLFGGRYDATSSSSRDYLGGTTTAIAANRFSPRVGLTYEPVPTTALYFNWANGFVPTTGVTASGTALAPITSEQYEVGVKQQLLDKRLQATVALFQVTRSNFPTPDLNNPGFQVAAGRARSRGVEFDMAGQILPGWNAVASYAYTWASVIEDNSIPVGSQLAGVAQHAGQVWTTYEFTEASPLRGIGFGIGVRAETKRQATLPNSFYLPGYARLDAAAWYKFDAWGHKWRAQLNATNLTDARIYDTDGGYSLRPQAPVSVLGTLSAQF